MATAEEWRRKAAGLTGAEEPFTEEESRIIALQTANSFSAFWQQKIVCALKRTQGFHVVLNSQRDYRS